MGIVSNAWRSTIIADETFWSSDMLFDMTGARIELKDCLRLDRELFSAYSRMPALYISTDQASIIQSNREHFPVEEPSVHNLRISYETHIKINTRKNMRLAPPDATYIKVQGNQAARCAQQSMLILAGFVFCCVSRTRKGIHIQCSIQFNIVKKKLTSWSCKQHSARMRLKNAHAFHIAGPIVPCR